METAAQNRTLSGHLELPRDQVHVWHADLDAFASRECPRAFLSHGERERAARFRFERDRGRFIAGRQILRQLVSTYLDLNPAEVSFRYSVHGKPELDDLQIRPRLAFNISHSGPVALFAFVWERKVGVDVEQVRADIQVCGLAEHFFSLREQVSLKELPTHMRQEAFFACWTRKEAFVKAKGEGLSLPLDQFDVSLVPGRPAEILATYPDAEERQRWSMWRLDIDPPYQAALVVEGGGVKPMVYSVSKSDAGPTSRD